VPDETWGGSLHQTFRILPQPSPNLRPFLESDGLSPEEVLGKLPYDKARSSGGDAPDPKRYRDGRQVYQTAGLVYEAADRLRVTGLGRATLRWLDIIHEKNVVILGRHAAYALAACQLRNPTGAGTAYAASMVVFPFAFIWRAMLALDNRISSDELNRAIFKVRNEDELGQAIGRIAEARTAGTVEPMGEETISGDRKDDRIIPWISIASFGWTLIANKGDAEERGYYTIPVRTVDVVREASLIRHKHREFQSVGEYVDWVSACAALPPDLR
jgi:hypothetical protein